MEPPLLLGFVLQVVNARRGSDRRKVLEILSSFCDIRNVWMDSQTRLVRVPEAVDINLVLHTFAGLGYKAEVVHIMTDKPSAMREPPMRTHHLIHERKPHDPNPRHVAFAQPSPHQRNELVLCHHDTRSGCAHHHHSPGRNGCAHHYQHCMNRCHHHHHHSHSRNGCAHHHQHCINRCHHHYHHNHYRNGCAHHCQQYCINRCHHHYHHSHYRNGCAHQHQHCINRCHHHHHHSYYRNGCAYHHQHCINRCHHHHHHHYINRCHHRHHHSHSRNGCAHHHHHCIHRFHHHHHHCRH